MARPKGSKNKPKDEVVEFDYEKMDDSTYSSLMSSPRKNDEEIQTFTVAAAAAAFAPELVRTQPANVFTPVASKSEDLFLVEGRVRLDRVGAEEPVFSDQRRLVWASNFDEAVSKFSNYFKSLSNYNERYVVVHVGGTEAIR